MDRRQKIGIYFTFGSNWLGGVYYLVNLVNSLNYLSEEVKDRYRIIIFYNNHSKDFIKLFKFPSIEFVAIPDINPSIAFLKSILLRKNYYLSKEIIDAKVDVLYPFNEFPTPTESEISLISWYPDLQHKFYPEYLTKTNLILREIRLRCLLKNGKLLILSSNDVRSHFSKFYPKSQLPMKVMPFVSLTDKTKLYDKEYIFEKYSIPSPYFIVCNQFYKHKDHKTLLKAIAILKKQKVNALLLMTGYMDDSKSSSYVNSLKEIIVDNDLDSNVRLLGVIPRDDQLSLMKHSLSVIQPSLFEGWSTVVEDVKSISGSIIVSDIEIHKEQLGIDGFYFENRNEKSLAESMNDVIDSRKNPSISIDYKRNVKYYADDFLSIIRQSTSS